MSAEKASFASPKLTPETLGDQVKIDVEYDENKRLAEYTSEQKEIIKERRKLLNGICRLIGRDFEMPLKFAEKGGGWYWNFQENAIYMDPDDILTRPMEYLRFLISHEAGHRRISRVSFIPVETWRQPGFSFMMNAIEDPRDNNFVDETIPLFHDEMKVHYDTQKKEDIEKKLNGEYGYIPRFAEAGMEYIYQWYNEVRGEPYEIDKTLRPEIQAVVKQTLKAASKSWLTYPSRYEAESETEITKYAEASYNINLKEIWPAFKTLVEEDIKDQKATQWLQKQQELNDPENQTKRTPKELTKEARKKVLDYLKDHPEEDAQAQEQAEQLIKEIEKMLNKNIEGMSSKTPGFEGGAKDGDEEDVEKGGGEGEGEEENNQTELVTIEPRSGEKQKKRTLPTKPAKTTHSTSSKMIPGGGWGGSSHTISEKITPPIQPEDLQKYKKDLKELLPHIRTLEHRLREIFIERRATMWESGYRAGKRIDIGKRIQERAKNTSVIETKSWQRRELPLEKDYAISLLIDVSGSMGGQKIENAYKAALIFAEVLQKLSITFSIMAFNGENHPIKEFDQPFGDQIRTSIFTSQQEVLTEAAGYNNDGFAIHEANRDLIKRVEKQKYIVVISDGQPAPDYEHAQYDLNQELSELKRTGKIKAIGVGIGPMTDHVESYYENGEANIPIAVFPARLAQILKKIIERGNIMS